MSELTLVIGSKTYSSWSLRPWLLLRYHNVAFKEVTVPLNQPDSKKNIQEHSPSGRVPVLLSGPVRVWESLAICEYVAETLKLPAAWPSDAALKAQARSLACEMLSSFADLRRELPMDCRRPPSPHQYSAAAEADIARVRAIWRECREQNGKGGDWLFGKFGIVDAMYAPVALRFHSYAVPLDGPERDYMMAVLNLPALREWLGAALLEPVAASHAAPAAAAPARKAEPEPERAAPPVAAAPKAAPKAPAPKEPPPKAEEKPAASSKKQVVRQDGGVKVTSYIIPD